MRRVYTPAMIFSLLIGLVTAFGVHPAYGQTSPVRKFNPPIVAVELSGKEPPPPGVPSEITYSAQGGGGGEGLEQPYVGEPMWRYLPPAFVAPYNLDPFHPSNLLTACGFTLSPTGTLTLPSGILQRLEGQQGQTLSDSRPDRCWTFAVPFTYGMELGFYKLDLSGSDGRLSHTWAIDYPYCGGPDFERGFTTNGRLDLDIVLLGYKPRASVTLNFYVLRSSDLVARADYLASRNFQTDEYGAVVIRGSVARSAPFTASDVIYEIDGYSEYWQYYPTVDGVMMDVNGRPCTFYGPKATVVPQEGSTLPLYPAFEDASRQMAELRDGTEVSVLDQKLALQNGRVVIWYQIHAADGREGWSFGPNMRMTPPPENATRADKPEAVLPVTATAPLNTADFRKYTSLWFQLKFVDMTAPGIQEYRKTIPANRPFSFSLFWCARTAAQLESVVAPIKVTLTVNELEIPTDSILLTDEKACRRWATILSDWPGESQLVVEARYSLSASTTDETGKQYAPGDYVQRIYVTVR